MGGACSLYLLSCYLHWINRCSSSMASYNILTPEYKIILLGEPGVGKTSFFFRVRDEVFLAESPTTVCTGVEHLEHRIVIDGQEVKVGQ